MTSQTKTCQNCTSSFTIEPDDFGFYEKINVPPPTFCPECRLIRRLAVRNERNFYKRTCELCKKPVISMYSEDKPFPVYCQACWREDGWDPMKYGREYDFTVSFFEQFRKLQDCVPRPNLRNTNMVNSEYCNYVGEAKNCYLCFGSLYVEDCLYGLPYESKYCVDTYLARESEYCYEVIDCEKLSRCAFVQDCASSVNLLYAYDCKNCQDCIGCVGLRNKQHHIFNQPCTSAEFKEKRDDILSRGQEGLEEVRQKFLELKLQIPHRSATTLQCTNVSGDHIVQSKNIRTSFDVKLAEDSAYSMRLIHAKDVHDVNYCEYSELSYEYLGFWKVVRCFFSNTTGESNDIMYSDFCSNSQNLFGCVGLRSKSYCILNKQYDKETYEELKKRIIDHMNKIGEFGEYFPIRLSLLHYNETVAQEFFPLTEEQAKQKGYGWQKSSERNYSITLLAGDIPKKISLVSDGILKEVLECKHQGTCNQQCTTAFKITASELQFYQRMNLPLPHLCPNCRHYERIAHRNPLKLWHRGCMCKSGHFHGDQTCPNEFETSYSPDRPEMIYCEQCYQQEVA